MLYKCHIYTYIHTISVKSAHTLYIHIFHTYKHLIHNDERENKKIKIYDSKRQKCSPNR